MKLLDALKFGKVTKYPFERSWYIRRDKYDALDWYFVGHKNNPVGKYHISIQDIERDDWINID